MPWILIQKQTNKRVNKKLLRWSMECEEFGVGSRIHRRWIKGADNVMLERAKGVSPNLDEHLTAFARQGLRTLVIGRKQLQAGEFAAWLVARKRNYVMSDMRKPTAGELGRAAWGAKGPRRRTAAL